MLQGDVADLVADHAQHLIVRHQIHQPGINPHAAVGTGERIYLLGLIDLEIQRNPIHLGDALGQLAQTLRIGIGLRKHLALAIQLDDILVHVLLDLCVADGGSLQRFHAAGQRSIGIEARTASPCQERSGEKDQISFHDELDWLCEYSKIIVIFVSHVTEFI